ncbi:unnamed protein product [Symbiodinium pilosum]|uniref:Uncharacterized protein n=1 Tax=Symbiodinium pilosum TaxID=2952 RepID=A0A812PQY4_SYMPI|nr:unnamed protein product [Symbiodinium pilosum]
MAVVRPSVHSHWVRFRQSRCCSVPPLPGRGRYLGALAKEHEGEEGLQTRQAAPVLDLTTKSVVRISRSMTVGQLAGALLQTEPFMRSSKGRLILEAENTASLSLAVNALALCNRRQSKAAAKQRVAFVPVVRVFRYAEPGKETVHLRRAMQLLMHPWDAAVLQTETAHAAASDIVSVRGDTDLRRLSGLVESRFLQSSVGIGEVVVVRCMGNQAIDKMVLPLDYLRLQSVHFPSAHFN